MHYSTSPKVLRTADATASARAFIARFDSVYAVDPALAQIPAPVRQAVIALLDRVTNGVDRLLALEPTPRGWRARFLENGKPVLAEWDGRELVTTLLSDLPLKGYQRTDAVPKNCVKGRWCVGKKGVGSCISVKKKCRQELQMREMEAADRITEMLRQQAGTPTPAAQPPASRGSKRGGRRRAAPVQPPEKTPIEQLKPPEKTPIERLKEAGLSIFSHITPDNPELNELVRPNVQKLIDLYRAAQEMGGEWNRVYFKDLRKRFPQLSRSEFDELIKTLHRLGAAAMMPIEDPPSITKEIDEGAIDVGGGVKRHFLRIRR